MKIVTKHDPFELQTCLAGLGGWLINVNVDLYVFCYYLTFKRELKSYFYNFNDAFVKPVHHPDFFLGIEDYTVKHCLKADDLIYTFYLNFMTRNCLLEDFLFEDQSLTAEVNRYAPTLVPSLKKKSYGFMKLSYDRYLEQIMNTMYYYCCALTLNSYLIPLKMKVRLELSHNGSFRYLNIENREVYLLTELMLELESIRKELRN